MTRDNDDLLAVASELEREARDRVDGGLDDALAWIATALDDPDRGRPLWVWEAACQIVGTALYRADREPAGAQLLAMFAARERAEVVVRTDERREELHALARLFTALVDDELPGEPEDGLVEAPASLSGSGQPVVTIRPAKRHEVPSLLHAMRTFLTGDHAVAIAGSFAAYDVEAEPARADAHYLVAVGPDGVIGGSVIVNADSAYPELGPAVVAPGYRGHNLAYAMTMIHCLQQSCLETDRERVYWSAVPTGSTASATSLRRCGFNPSGDVWTAVSERLQERHLSDKASWLAATPRAIAMRFLAACTELGGAKGPSWEGLADLGDSGLSVAVQLNGSAVTMDEIVPLAAQVTAYG